MVEISWADFNRSLVWLSSLYSWSDGGAAAKKAIFGDLSMTAELLVSMIQWMLLAGMSAVYLTRKSSRSSEKELFLIRKLYQAVHELHSTDHESTTGLPPKGKVQNLPFMVDVCNHVKITIRDSRSINLAHFFSGQSTAVVCPTLCASRQRHQVCERCWLAIREGCSQLTRPVANHTSNYDQ